MRLYSNISDMKDILEVIYTVGGKLATGFGTGYPGVQGTPGYQWHTAGYRMPDHGYCMPNSGHPLPPGDADAVPSSAAWSP